RRRRGAHRRQLRCPGRQQRWAAHDGHARRDAMKIPSSALGAESVTVPSDILDLEILTLESVALSELGATFDSTALAGDFNEDHHRGGPGGRFVNKAAADRAREIERKFQADVARAKQRQDDARRELRQHWVPGKGWVEYKTMEARDWHERH